MDEPTLDYAIVGGGAAGLYVALRILESHPEARVKVYEFLDEVGGRLCSVRLPGLPFVAEIGGMRFKDTHLLLTSTLKYLRDVESLGLATRSFDYPLLFASLRGRSYSSDGLELGYCSECGAGIPYVLAASELGVSPAKLLLRTLLLIVKDVTFDKGAEAAAAHYGVSIASIKVAQDKIEQLVEGERELNHSLRLLKPAHWNFLRHYGQLDNLYLHDYGFWQVLTRRLSPEAFQFVRNTLGYESVVGNWNAAEAIIWFLSEFADARFQAIKDGYQAFPLALKKLVSSRGAKVLPRHRLKEIVLESEKEGRFLLDFNTSNGKLRVKAKQVFLCLPQGALLRIAGLSTIMGSSYALLQAVKPHALLKMLFGYRNSWWLKDPRIVASKASHGMAVTDTPLRQVYYFGAEASIQSKGTAARNPSLLMASYSDEQYAEFWRPSPDDVPRSPFVAGERDRHASRSHTTISELEPTPQMKHSASQLIAMLHPKIAVPQPLVAIFKDWRDAPFYAGWHTWRVGLNPWTVRESLRSPATGLYICGEAYSSEQGWVEGALKSAELALEAAGFTGSPTWINQAIYTSRGFDNHTDYIRF